MKPTIPRYITFVAVIQAILFVLHYVVYKSTVVFFGVTGAGQLLAARIVFTLLSLSFAVASVLAFRFNARAVRIFYTAAAVWLGTAYWLLLANVAASVAWLVGAAAGATFAIAPLGAALMLAALLVSAYGVWNSFQPDVRTVPIQLENLPAQWRGRRAVLVADSHFGSVRGAGTAKNIAARIAALHPDAVFISGDFYDGTPLDADAVAQPLREIQARFGTFFAAGNHEEYGDKSVFLAALRRAGVRVLVNEAVDVDGLCVIGVDYADAANPQDEARILASLNLGQHAPSILIKHVPDNVDVARAAGISLQLSGHTHSGQMWPFGYIARAVFGKFYHGLNAAGATQVYTTSGVGTWGQPQRVGTHAEIVVLEF